jgi:Flp pilus assembly protein TadG
MNMRTKLHREDGAAAVEFALVVSLLVMLVFGLMEYGLAFWQIQNLRSATREGARVAAVRGSTDQISTAMENASAGSIPPGSSGYFSVTVGGVPSTTGCTGSTMGQEVTVLLDNGSLDANVQEAFSIEVPLLPPVTLNPTLSGTFRCE